MNRYSCCCVLLLAAAVACAPTRKESTVVSPGAKDTNTAVGVQDVKPVVTGDEAKEVAAPGTSTPASVAAPPQAEEARGTERKRELRADDSSDRVASKPAVLSSGRSAPAAPVKAKAGAAAEGEPSKRPVGAVAVDAVPPPPVAVVAAPAIKAGRHDDNKQYNRFLAFLHENAPYVTFPLDVSERLVLRALDRDGRSIPNCGVTILGRDGKQLNKGTTYADGKTQFFPSADSKPGDRDYSAEVTCASQTKRAQLLRSGRRDVDVPFGFSRQLPRAFPLDIAIVIDTTGSMQNQIDRLKKTLRAIHFQLTQLPSQPDVRFGLVAYRDRGDEYTTRVSPFTGDVGSFQKVLDALDADGGGDNPEDMQAALEKALHVLSWRADAVRLGFVIADAPPHTDYGDESFNYREAMRESLRRGIKWVSVGAGGLGRDGEVVFRQLSQFTMAEYVFVTEGPSGDREGGVGEASHHVGANYATENLDQAIVRIVRRELSYLTNAPKDFDDTIVATAAPTEPRENVLGPAVDEVLRQLADYSSLRLGAGTPLAVVPVASADARYRDVAGYLSDRMTLAASRNPVFKLVERDLAALAQEQKLQLSDLFDVTTTVPIGKLIGADVLIVAKLTVTGDAAALFAKLIRVDTGEVLAVSRVEIAKATLTRS